MNLILGITCVLIIIALFFMTDPFNLFNKPKKPIDTNNLYDFEKKQKEKQESKWTSTSN